MAIDPSRLRNLDHLRLCEQLSENPELGWMLDDMAEAFRDMAMYADKAEERDFARQKHLAILDVKAALAARIAGFRLGHETELAEEREAAAKQEAA
jgi:hypothetical protein